MDQIVNVNNFQELAKRALPRMYYDYFSGGTKDEHTLKENVETFHRIMSLTISIISFWFRPRALVDVCKIDMSTSILGYSISAPIMVTPIATQKLAHPEGEIATAKAAAACNTIMILSCMSSYTIEEVASSCINAVQFLHVYVFKRRDITVQMVKRAEKAGFKAIVLTDAPRLGRREADIKNKMISPQLSNFGGLFSTEVRPDEGLGLEALASIELDASISWKL